MTKFEFTFIENKKYNAATRTVVIDAPNEVQAKYIFAQTYDSFKFNKETARYEATNKRVKIQNIREIKDESNTTN